MRFKFILFALCFVGFGSYAQNIKSFAQDTGVYIKELGVFMAFDKSEEAEKVYKQFLVEWKDTVFTEAQKYFMIRISNKMLIEKLRATPDFVSLLKALSSYSRQHKGEAIFMNWQKIVEKTLTENKKAFRDFLDFSANLFEDNTIYTSNSKNWQCTSPDYELTDTMTVQGILNADAAYIAANKYTLNKYLSWDFLSEFFKLDISIARKIVEHIDFFMCNNDIYLLAIKEQNNLMIKIINNYTTLYIAT